MSYFQFLFESSIVLLVLTLAFWLLVRKETYFQTNRFALLSILLLSVGLYFIPAPSYLSSINFPVVNGELPALVTHNFQINQIEETTSTFQTTTIPTGGSVQGIASTLQADTPVNFADYFSFIYWLGFLVFMLRFLFHTFWIFRIFSQSTVTQQSGYRFVTTSKKINPFSFFKYIFLHKDHLNHSEFEHILNHEKVHAAQYHSVDLLLAELATIVFWFHPAVWLLNRLIRQNLEYIADANVLKTGASKKHYQYHLLRVSVPNYSSRLTNHFNHSLLKNRIAMMNVNQSSRQARWKYFFLLPLVVGLFVLLNNTAQAQSSASSTQKSEAKASGIVSGTQKATSINGTATSTVGGGRAVGTTSQGQGISLTGKGSAVGTASQGQGTSIASAGNSVGTASQNSTVSLTGESSVGSDNHLTFTVERGEATVQSATSNSIGGGTNYSVSGAAKFEGEKDMILVVITADFDQAQLDKLQADLKKEDIIVKYEDIDFNSDGKLSSLKVKIKDEKRDFSGMASTYTDEDGEICQPIVFYYIYDEEGKGEYHDIKTHGIVTGLDSEYIPAEIKEHLNKVKNGYVIGKVSYD